MTPFAPSSSRRRAVLVALVALLGGEALAQQGGVIAPVTTVTDAVFRSRWVGPQADRSELLGLVPTDEGIEPVEDLATKLREGLWLGSLRVRPGLGSGWDYSNRNSSGQTTSGSDDQSFFLSPSLGLEYGRGTGPWDISVRAGGGYLYYLNPDYTPNGTGGQRNPFDATMSLGLGHSGMRHAASVGGTASFGNGQNVQAGGNATQFQGSASAGYSYLVNDYVTTGGYVAYQTLITDYESGSISQSELASLRGGWFVDWLWTGKTTLGIKTEAGRMTQDVQRRGARSVLVPVAGGEEGETVVSVVDDDDEGVATREFVQVLATAAHNLTAKVLLIGGIGGSYTADENIPQPDTKYTGVRPVYLAGMQYDASEKTSLRLYTSLEGFDIVPTYGLSATWRPRMTTAFTLSVYQNQNFSITTVDQFQVNRGFVAGVQQTLFSKFVLGVSGGWQETENISLSKDRTDGLSYDYAFVSCRLRWNINSWASWQASLMSSTGNRTEPSSSISFPETTASVGLNLLF